MTTRKRKQLCTLEVSFTILEATTHAAIRNRLRQFFQQEEIIGSITVDFFSVETKEVTPEPHKRRPTPQPSTSHRLTQDEVEALLQPKGDQK